MDMSEYSIHAPLELTEPLIDPDNNEKIKKLKEEIKKEAEKSKESKRDRFRFNEDEPPAPPYNISLEHAKRELKKLEAKQHKKPKTLKLSELDHRMWKFFLPVLYRDALFSEKKISHFPHRTPYDLHEKWKSCTDGHAFEDYEIRATRPDSYLQYFPPL